MTYKLILGDYAYSSWSLRGWLLFEKFGIARDQAMVDFIDQIPMAEMLAEHTPAKTVPTLVIDDDVVVSDSLAIAEELASRHPDAGIWPSDPKHRAIARTLAAEMHSGFMDLRCDCPMNLRVSYSDSVPRDEVLSDLKRLETIWAWAREECEAQGPWLCGDYCAADAFFAPVAARVAGYNLPMEDLGRAYVKAHLHDLAFRRWRAMGLVRGADLPWYAKDYPTRDWPGPKPMEAAASDAAPENPTCSYSGKPSTHMLELDGRVFGFCNAFCRDKTVADPDAWPAFIELKA